MADSSHSSQPGVGPLIGRMLMCWIFIHSALGQIVAFSYWTGRLAEKGVPLPAVGIALSILIQLVGGLLLLIGFQTTCASWALIIFLIPTTLIMHNFWMLQGAARDLQENNFLRNLAIMGGLLFVITVGGGYYSIDSMRASRRKAS